MFDTKEFIDNNKTLVKKYLKKNTKDLYIPDFIPSRDNFYGGNETITNVNYSPEFTELQKLEYIKCARDVVYFTEKYIKIISVDDGVIPFKLYDYQRDLLYKFQDNRFVLSLQSRQTGKTQTTAAFFTWFALFHSSKTCAILANKAAQAREILERIQTSFEELPFFLKTVGVKEYNKGSMVLGNKSKIFSAASSSSSIRGKSISLLYIDEAAFIPNCIQFYESTYPVISSGKESRVIITSTPNGTRGMFYKLWQESIEGSNAYVHHKVIWNQVPGRDKKWKEEQIANSSVEQFQQEHECLFRGSVDSLISGEVLSSLPVRKRYKIINNDLKIFNDPEEDRVYYITVDVSRGVGNDNSAFIVWDVTEMPYKVVATYKNNRIAPMIYPGIIHNTALKYNEAYVLIEINDAGGEVANGMFYDYEYENVIRTVTEKNRQTIGYGSSQKIGVRTTTAVKAIGCSSLKMLVEDGKVKLNDPDIIDELGNFVAKGKSYEASVGAHDDLSMCCVLFAWSTTQSMFKDLTNSDLVGHIRQEHEEELMPFGIIDSPAYDVMSEDEISFIQEHDEFMSSF